MRKLLLLLLPFMAGCRDRSANHPKNNIEPAATKSAPVLNTITAPTFSFNYPQQKLRCQELFELNKKKRQPETEKKLITWDFNGTTEVPGQGKIACGYFVTTTLRDAGMKINRVKMAQCVSQNLLYDLCYDFKKFSNKPLAYFVKEVEKSGYGLYIVGLDNHTGYIYNDGKEVWFIHSGVLPPRCALREKAIESVTLNNSAYRVVGRINLVR
jgi:hypothetical protein